MKKGNVIYKVTNVTNGKVYIGATTYTMANRMTDHLRKANKGTGHDLHEAIATYGTGAFEWEEIDTASSLNELAEKERNYIKKYNSKEQGYNSDSGGGFKKTIYQYGVGDGSLMNEYDSLESASSAVNTTKKQLSRACLSVSHELNGYYWSYSLTEPFKPLIDKRKMRVLQKDEKGNIIGEYNSISEASAKTGINKTSIAKVCRGERNFAGGYKWVHF